MAVREFRISLGDTYTDVISFGRGKKPLIIIPGLSIRSIRKTGIFRAYFYNVFAKDYRVYILDRREDIPKGFTIRQFADDIVKNMDSLHIKRADFIGISQGGMITQSLMVNHRERVHKAVLCVTCPGCNETIRKTVERWILFAKNGSYLSIENDLIRNMYSDRWLGIYEKIKWLMPAYLKFQSVFPIDKFINLAGSVFSFDEYENLDPKMGKRILILGGTNDKIVSPLGSLEIREKTAAKIHMYEGLGHGAYLEAGDFNRRMLCFFNS